MDFQAEYKRLFPTFSAEQHAFLEPLLAQHALLAPLLEKHAATLARLEALETELAALKRMVFGQKAEPLPRLKPPKPPEPTPEEKAESERKRKETRAERQQARAGMETEDVPVPLPVADQVCPKCQGTTFRPLPEGETRVEYDFVQAHLRKRRIVREKWACSCGHCILTAPDLPQVGTGSLYSPALHAHIVVAKCADSVPLYRQEKMLARAGVSIDRNTLIDLFHRVAREVRPIYLRLLELVRQEEVVYADETTLKVQDPGAGKCKMGWMWTFVNEKMALYVYKDTRSGRVPAEVLGDSAGWLVTDGYSGYNEAIEQGGRTRAGCWAHVRRKFWPVLETDGKAVAEHALEQISRLYRIEDEIEEAGGDRVRGVWRREKSRPVVERLFLWAKEELGRARPSSGLRGALGYLVGQEAALCGFLVESGVKLDNNISERALRTVALGRKNFLFAGSDEGAEHLGILQSVVGTCVVRGVNPERYLSEVLVAVQRCPVSEIDRLLPGVWGCGG